MVVVLASSLVESARVSSLRHSSSCDCWLPRRNIAPAQSSIRRLQGAAMSSISCSREPETARQLRRRVPTGSARGAVCPQVGAPPVGRVWTEGSISRANDGYECYEAHRMFRTPLQQYPIFVKRERPPETDNFTRQAQEQRAAVQSSSALV